MEEKLKYLKAFNIGSLFQKSTRHILGIPQKNLDISSEYSEDYSVANVTGAKTNNGASGYLKDDGIVSIKKNINHMTIVCDGDGGTGAVFFQDRYFTSTATANIIDILDINLKNILDSNHISYLYISNLLTKIFLKSGTYSRNYKIDNSNFNREIILLPVISCKATESIWEDIDEDGNITYLTLDVEYIKELMEAAKKRKEEKTIRYYEAEKAKYEAEKAKYENDSEFMDKLKRSNFKAYKLGDLFRFKRNIHPTQMKYLEFSETKDENHNIAFVSTSRYNNGIRGYIPEDDISKSIKMINHLTLADDGSTGACFFQTDDFVIAGHVNTLTIKDPVLKSNLDNNIIAYEFLASMIRKILMHSGIYSRQFKATEGAVSRELILLPTLEGEIQPDIMSYYYILGQERLYQNKINHYNQLIGG